MMKKAVGIGSILLLCNMMAQAAPVQVKETPTKTAQVPVIVSSAELRHDRRLNSPITVTAKQYHLGELLEVLQAQTGVSLSVSDRGDASGEPVAARLDGLSLREAMESLQSLFSYKRSLWYWERTGDADKPSYNLRYSRSGREAADELREQVKQEAVAYMKEKIAARSKKQLASFLEKEGFQYSDYAVDTLFSGFAAFKSALSAKEQGRVLQGGEVRLPTDKLPKEALPFIEKTSGLNNFTPGWIGFSGRVGSGIAPDLWVGFENMGWSAYGTGSQYDQRVQDRLAKDWMMPGDGVSWDAVEKQVLEAPAKIVEPRGRFREENRLKQIGEAQNVNYMARIPYQPPGSITFANDVLYGKTVGTALVEQFPGFSHKWCGRVLLVSYPAWVKPDTVIPYPVVKLLRAKTPPMVISKERVIGSGPPPTVHTRTWEFADLCAIAAVGQDLSPEQWERLAKDYEVLSPFADWSVVLAKFVQSPEFAAEVTPRRGVPAGRIVALSSKNNWRERTQARLDAQKAAHVQLYISTKKPTYFYFVLYDADHKFLRSVVCPTQELLVTPTATP